jgi:hypothetical protein
MSLSKHAQYLRRVWVGTNADNMLKAVTTKDLDLYLMNRKKVVDQIKLFDEELKVTPLVCSDKVQVQCAWCDNTTLNKVWPEIPSDLR